MVLQTFTAEVTLQSFHGELCADRYSLWRVSLAGDVSDSRRNWTCAGSRALNSYTGNNNEYINYII